MSDLLHKLVAGVQSFRARRGRLAPAAGPSHGSSSGGASETAPDVETEVARLINAAAQAVSNGIMITDRGGVILWVNPSFSRITGYQPHEIVGQTPRILRSDRQPPSFYQELWQTILAGRIWRGEIHNRNKSGEVYVEDQTIIPVPGADGEVAYFIGVKQDITERKRYQESLETMVERRTADLRAAQRKLLEQQRLEQEIVLAAQVQASILPHRTPELPGYEFAGLALAARYVSGDMYDWIALGPEHCYLTLADIAGKGIPAAMMTSTARALLRDGAARKHSPGPALSSLNRSLYDDLTHIGSFITVVAADLDRRTAAVDYASAGHTEVLWVRGALRSCERLPATAPPIGTIPDGEVGERRIHLCPGDLLLFYSDGVTEAEDENGEFFGIDRLVAQTVKSTALPAAALVQSIVDAVDGFSRGTRTDDLTLVVVKALARTVPFRFRGELAHVEEGLELIRSLGRAYPPGLAYDLELAASEIFTNVIEHAYRSSGGELRGEVRLEPDRVQLDVYDDGLPFDLSALPGDAPERLAERGRGVHIVRQVMDEVSYSPATPAGNHWRLVKMRGPEGPGDGQRP